MSQTGREQLEEQIADSIVSSTIPGSSNSGIFDGLQRASRVAELVEDDLNNWVDILDVRVYGENIISICSEYRWTIYRWASHDMEDYMQDNGWQVEPHRLADTHLREEDQMEARYKKQFGDTWVYINILVLFPERAFDELNAEESYKQTKEKKIKEKEQESKKRRLMREMREE
jgi:hypothetical protein